MDWLSTNDAANILGCTYGRIRQLMRDGRLVGQKLNGRAWIIQKSSVEELAKKPKGVGRNRVAVNGKKSSKTR